MEERATKFSIGGALLAALAASSCCLGPIVLAALGVGGAGAAGALGAYRPYLLAGTAALLVAGFYFGYRKPPVATGDACGCERPRANPAARIGLWSATVAIVLVAAAPPLFARWEEAKVTKADATLEANLATDLIAVPGIDCQACAAPLRRALGKVGGFHDLKLDIPKQALTVTYEPAAGRLAAYVAAINALGYEAKLPRESEGRR
jgi:mercuric ion transport protein